MNTDMLKLAAALTARGEPFAVATVVRREAPSSARLGDTAIITRDGRLRGFIGGSCTRSTVAHQALQVLARREARLISFRDDDPPRADDIVSVPMTCHSGGSVEIYIDPVFPAPRLLLLGSSPVNQALAGLGAAMGYEVRIVAVDDAGDARSPAEAPANSGAAHPRADAPTDNGAADPRADAPAGGGDETAPAVISVDRLPRFADRAEGVLLFALVATMGESDEDMLEAALAARPDYLGVIASRRRMEEIRARLKERGAPANAVDTIDGPAGLDIGARRPEEIAVSILAKIVTVRRQATTAVATRTPAATASDDGEATPAASSGAAGSISSTAPAPGTPVRREKPRAPSPEGAIDPVCGMSVPTGASRPRAEHDGHTYWFCCDGCRERFLEDPRAHLAVSGIEDSWGDGESA